MSELYADFARDGGTYMILKTRDGLRPEQLNRVQRAMLAAVTVPNLLRLDVREVDFEVSLHYDITGKRMLSHCLKSDKIGMPEFYSLLLQVVAVLEDCKRYMLAPANFLLDQEHIFVEEPLACGILHFTYVPWYKAPTAVPLSQTLLALITRLLTCVSRVEGDGVPQLVRFCGDELFSLGELKRMLLHFLSGDNEDEKKVAGAGQPRPVRTSPSDSIPSSLSPAVKEYLPSMTADGSGAGADSFARAGAVEVQEHWPGVDEEELPKAPIKPTYFVLGLILVDALVWKFLYLDRPGGAALYISLSATVLLALAAYGLWRKKLTLSGSGKGAGAREPEPDFGLARGAKEDISIPGRSDASGMRESFTEWTAYSPQPVVESPPNASPPIEQPDWGTFPEMEAPPATMLLNRSMLQGQKAPGSERAPRYYLERFDSTGAVPERISMSPGSFVIGRSEELVQYVENTAGVSRAHIELLVTSNGCTLKDLGSKNGTRLKGEQIAPYKDYVLEAGDVFTVADTTFKFGVESL